MQAGRLIPFGSEVSGDLGVQQSSRIEFADALLERFHIGRRFIAAHTAFVPELFMGPGLPVDLKPNLSMRSLAVDDDVPDHQAQHLLAISTRGSGSLPESGYITSVRPDGRSIRFCDRNEATVAPRLIL